MEASSHFSVVKMHQTWFGHWNYKMENVSYDFLTEILTCRDVVSFPGFVDCVYLDAPGELNLDNGLGDNILISNTKWVGSIWCSVSYEFDFELSFFFVFNLSFYFPIFNVVGPMQCYGTHICRWKHAIGISFVLRMLRYLDVLEKISSYVTWIYFSYCLHIWHRI